MKTLSIVLALTLAAAPAVGQFVEDSLPVGGNFVGHLEYNSRADVVYGASNGGYRFFAIACSSNTVVANYQLTYANWTAYNARYNKAYCSYGYPPESILVVSGETHQPVRRLHQTDANIPVVDSIGNRLYVSCTESNAVAVIDCATDSVIATIPVGVAPLKLHVNPLRRKLYVQNYDENTVSIVDMTTNQVIRTVPIGGYPLSGWYDSECDKYYCGTLANEAVVLSGETDTVLYRIPLGGSVGAVGGEVTGLVAFAVLETRSVDIASRYTGLVKTSVTVGEGPRALAWGEGAARLYSANSYTDDVTVLTGDGFRVVRTLPVGDDPFCFAYSPVQRRLYVGHLNGHKVYVIKDTVGGIEETCPDSPSSAPLLAEPSHFRRRVSLSAPAAQRMSADLEVWSAAGQMVRELKPVPDRRGRESCVWDGRDWQGEDAPAGAYFVTLRGALSAASVKVVKLE